MRRPRVAERIGRQTKGYKKRATATLLAVALLVCLSAVFAPRAAAKEPLARSTAVERLRRGLFDCDARIDLAVYALSPAELGRIYTALLEDDPLLFHVAPRLSYTVTTASSGEVVAAIYPVYLQTGSDLAAARVFWRATLDDLLAAVEAATAGHARTEAETALLVHDLLAARYDYDVRVLAEGAGGGNRDVYTFFRDGVGVCQAYALATLALLRRAGLEADFVSSPAMDHAWVHVRVGGTWYHMDVTRDDPVTTLPDGGFAPAGMVTHTRVLRSDAGMRALGYHDFFCAGGHTCTDGRYETPAAVAMLAELSAPLGAVPRGDGVSLVWVGETAAGALMPLCVTEAGMFPQVAGDMDGDGAATPGDLLLLGAADVPVAWMRWMRRRLVEGQ